MAAVETGKRRVRRGALRVVWLGTLSLAGCSEQSTTADATVSSNRPSTPTAAADAGPRGAAPAGDVAATRPGNGGTATEGGPVVTREPPADEPAASAADAGAAVDLPLPACERSVTDANKAVVRAAIDELFVQGDITAVDRYWGEPYLQHNPIAASGVDTFRGLFSGLISPGNSIYELERLVGECELVLIHGDYTSFGGPTFDMFRVEGGRLVEHWDAASIGSGPNASGHTALDGESVIGDIALSAQNESLVVRFVENVLIGAAHDAIGDYMSPDLIEHNPESSDGSVAYLQYLSDRAITYRQLHHQLGDGNFVFVLSEGAVGGTDVAHYDLFRVADSRIVEHWDGRRNVPATTPSGLGIF